MRTPHLDNSFIVGDRVAIASRPGRFMPPLLTVEEVRCGRLGNRVRCRWDDPPGFVSEYQFQHLRLVPMENNNG